MNIRNLFTFESRGPATLINCKSCGASIHEHFDHEAGHGILGYSGHKDDCDYLLAGLTIDIGKQDAEDEKEAYKKAPKDMQKLYDELNKVLESLDGGFEDIHKRIFLRMQATMAIKYHRRVRKEHI